ncbi:NAD-dependent epimerase/dehydratase family protein [Rouxiella chamberiensis]|uniref:NAD-dependent epimerase/dehydratase family protein n=1 Tax=Rouxiella chamberiensis TaxID=1513468 RepID=UPI002ED0B586
MKVLITGANGFVGLNIVNALLAAKHQVTAYVRASSNLGFLEPLGVTLIHGELNDSHSLRAAMTGQDAVIHTAGNTSSNPRDWPLLEAVNVDGTNRVIEAALDSGIARLVYTSTSSTIGAPNDPLDEATEPDPSARFSGQESVCQKQVAGRGAGLPRLRPWPFRRDPQSGGSAGGL